MALRAPLGGSQPRNAEPDQRSNDDIEWRPAGKRRDEKNGKKRGDK
jgi:hypothetical protein